MQMLLLSNYDTTVNSS